LRDFLRSLAVVCVFLVVVGAGLYFFFGLRLVADGGGVPHLRFVPSAAARADAIEKHRAAQRAAAPAMDVAAPTPVASGVATTPVVDAPPALNAAKDPVLASAYWTDFRGPRRDGAYTEVAVRTSWPAGGLKPQWKQPIGGGYASFAIARGRAFTIEQRRDQEVVAAYDVVTGRELWTQKYDAAFREVMGGDGPRATPTWSDGLVYSLGALGELRCLDEKTGAVIWRVNILDDNGAANLQWGMSASPLIVDDTVVVLPGGPNGKSVVAYDRRTGRRAWSALSDRQAYVAPMLATLAGVRQLIVVSASRMIGLSPDKGELLWEYSWTTSYDINAAQPLLVSPTRLFISSGYGQGAAVIELSDAGGALAAREVWKNVRMKNRFASSVLHDGFIYGFDENILACVDAATGALKWKGGRYGYGELILASGQLIVLTEDGELALVRAAPAAHEELARIPALEGKTWNHPAMDRGILLIRNTQEMAAFDLRLK